MQCDVVRQQLACYRELTEGEREAVQRHLSTCPVCMAIWEQYQAQDRALAIMPNLVPSRDWAAQVRSRTVDAHAKSPRRGRKVAANMIMIATALVVALTGTAVGVSAQALPGSALYPVKRAVEQARLTLTVGEQSKEAYRQQLDETRREEAIAVAERDDVAPVAVAFQGTLTGVSENAWFIDGVKVEVAPEIAEAGAALVGQRVGVDAEAGSGTIAASAVYVQPTPTRHAVAQPESTLAPTTESGAPTAEPTAQASATALAQATATDRPAVEAIKATATAINLAATLQAKLTPTSSISNDAAPSPTRRFTRLATRPSIITGPTATPEPTAYPVEPTVSVEPTRIFTRIPTLSLTRIATPRITRVVDPTDEPTVKPTSEFNATTTPVPTQGSTSTSPTVAPTADATPTVWTKPITPTPVVTEPIPTATNLYNSPTPVPPTATPVKNTPTPQPTTMPSKTSPPTREPATATIEPVDVPTSTPKPVDTPVSSVPKWTPTPQSVADPVYDRVPDEPPTPFATVIIPVPYPYGAHGQP